MQVVLWVLVLKTILKVFCKSADFGPKRGMTFSSHIVSFLGGHLVSFLSDVLSCLQLCHSSLLPYVGCFLSVVFLECVLLLLSTLCSFVLC